ncbi:hypothetical protein V7S43_014617 [Phytophthora oleae]|uniref:PiggyBac transposable element-derived protein domain-containing protein n=1 Tax=Phytophthora oleae TaxID=2107226 RepID=A0ABD3F5Y3_9STRA
MLFHVYTADTPTRQAETRPLTPQLGTPSTPPTLLYQMFMDQFVAFSPAREPWMKKKLYRLVGTAFIVGRVCRRALKAKNKLQIMWLDSQFQSCVENLSIGMVQLGIDNYRALTKDTNNSWQDLMLCGEGKNIEADDLSELQEAEEYEAYDPMELLPTSVAEAEAVSNMRFDPSVSAEAPQDLYQHDDRTTATYLRPEYRHLFEHSASSSFLRTYHCISGGRCCMKQTRTLLRITSKSR